MKNYGKIELNQIFRAAESTLASESSFNKSQWKKSFEPYKQLSNDQKEDNMFFQTLVRVTFYSGFKAKTVSDKLEAINRAFPDYKKVEKYDEEKIQNLLSNKELIRHETKFRGLIHNAKQIKALVKEYGSFNGYLESFGDPGQDQVLLKIIKDLRKRFKYLGGITVFHFLTDIGFDVVKPDRVLCRIFFRLGLVESEDDLWGVIKAGRSIAAATKEPIRYVDIIFVKYGQVDRTPEFGLDNGICLSQKPRCEKCGLYQFCTFENKKKIK